MSMPWGAGWPITTGNNVTLYDTRIKIWKSRRQRHRMLGEKYWPQQNLLFYEGRVSTVTAIDADTVKIADNSATWQTSPKRWVDWSNPATGNTFEPANYDVVLNINADDPRDVIQLPIIDQLSATEITVSRHILDDYIAAKVITVYGDFGETEMAFIRPDGLMWAKQWPRRPNDNEYEHSTLTAATTTTATDSRALWFPNMWTGKELMCLAGGRLKRIAITGNTEHDLQFATQPVAPDLDEYAIIKAGGIWLADNDDKCKPWTWYTGLMTQYGSHYPDDSHQLTISPATSAIWQEHDPDLGCVEVNHTTNIFDNPVWTGFDNQCDSDRSLSPDFYKSNRAVQIDQINSIPQFVNVDKIASGYTGTVLPLWTVAECLKSVGLGFSTTASTGSAGILAIPGTVPPKEGISCYYTVLDDNGDVLAQGSDGQVFTGTLHGSAITTACSGKAVFISYGLPRYREKQFRYAYEKTMFVADYEFVPIDPDNPELGNRLVVYDPPAPKDPTGTPPDNFGIGSFQTKAKSTTARVLDTQGMAADGTDAFVTGQYYRYIGDDWNDPADGYATHEQYAVSDSRPDGFPPDYLFYDRFFRGLPRAAFRETWLHQRQGRATATSKYYIEDTKQDWWIDWYGGGESRVETLTATSGSTTTFTDSSKINGSFWNAGSGRYVNFILEVDKVSAGVTTTYYLPITAMNASTGTLTFAAVTGLTVAAGDVGRIREPKYELNRWKGRTVRITKADGTTQDLAVTLSDRHRLYFAVQASVIEAAVAYEIIELQYGAVYKWDGSKWVPPTGADSRKFGAATSPNFHGDLFENCPTVEKLYGFYMKDDIGHMEVLMNLYKIENKLYETKQTYSWVNGGEPTSNSENAGYVTSGSDEGGFDNADFVWTDSYNEASTLWDAGGEITTDANPRPQMHSDGSDQFASDGSPPGTNQSFAESIEISRQCAYGQATGIPTLLQSTAAFWVYGSVDFGDTPQGSTDNTDTSTNGGYNHNIDEWTFNSGGDPISYHEWTSFSSVGPATTDTRTSTKFGSLDKPPLPQKPPSFSYHDNNPGDAPVFGHEFEGYYTLRFSVVLDWSVDPSVFLDAV